MPNYKNSKIYLLINFITTDTYVGSTCCALKKRKSEHKSVLKTSNLSLYTKLRQQGVKPDDIELILIESYDCENKTELLKQERYYIELTEANLNKHRPIVFEVENGYKHAYNY